MKNQFGLKQLLFSVLLLSIAMALLRIVFEPDAWKLSPAGVKWRVAAGVLAGMFLAAGIAAPVGWMGAAKKVAGSTAFIVCFVTGVLCTVHLSEWTAILLPRQEVYSEYAMWGMMASPIAAGVAAWLVLRMTRQKQIDTTLQP